MKISELFPRRYARGEDLNGKPVSLTVAHVTIEALHPQPGSPAIDKPVLYFQRATRGVILSPALARQIAALLGDDTDTWTGKRITIYPEPMRVAGRDCVAIRARAATNGESTPPPALTDEEE